MTRGASDGKMTWMSVRHPWRSTSCGANLCPSTFFAGDLEDALGGRIEKDRPEILVVDDERVVQATQDAVQFAPLYFCIAVGPRRLISGKHNEHENDGKEPSRDEKQYIVRKDHRVKHERHNNHGKQDPGHLKFRPEDNFFKF